MPDVMDEFAHLEKLETTALHLRMAELRGTTSMDAAISGNDLSDQSLKELVCIMRLLRGRASTSTRSTRTAADRRVVPTADML